MFALCAEIDISVSTLSCALSPVDTHREVAKLAAAFVKDQMRLNALAKNRKKKTPVS